MPLITVKLIENVFTPEQKKKLIAKLTDTMVEVEGENLRGATFVLIEDVKEGDWGIGGRALTANDVHKMQRSKAA